MVGSQAGPARRRRRVPDVVVYTRRRCGLCVRAEQIVAREARGASVRTVDVDTSEELAARYGVRVPVVTVDGTEVAELEVAVGDVRRSVRAARRRRRRRRRIGGSRRGTVA